jgi:hypothetical protein
LSLVSPTRAALEYGVGRHPGQVGDPLARVQHGDVVGDQLQGVAVAGADQHLEARGSGLPGERRDDVVGLEPVRFDVDDVERVEDLLDQRHLSGELRRRGRPVGLVLGVLRRAEGLPGHVERDGEVRRPLVAQHVDEHGREAVDGVGVLAGGGGEVLHRQGEERPVGHRVAVDQQEHAGPGICFVRRHASTLAVASDSLAVRCGTAGARLSRRLRRVLPVSARR